MAPLVTLTMIASPPLLRDLPVESFACSMKERGRPAWPASGRRPGPKHMHLAALVFTKYVNIALFTVKGSFLMLTRTITSIGPNFSKEGVFTWISSDEMNWPFAPARGGRRELDRHHVRRDG